MANKAADATIRMYSAVVAFNKYAIIASEIVATSPRLASRPLKPPRILKAFAAPVTPTGTTSNE